MIAIQGFGIKQENLSYKLNFISN